MAFLLCGYLFIIAFVVVISADEFPTGSPTSIPSSRPTARPSSRPTAQPSSRPTALPTAPDTELAFFILSDWGKSLTYGSRRRLSNHEGFFADDYIDNVSSKEDGDDTSDPDKGEGFAFDAFTIPLVTDMPSMQRDFKVVMANFEYWASGLASLTSQEEIESAFIKGQLQYWYDSTNALMIDAIDGINTLWSSFLDDEDRETTLSLLDKFSTLLLKAMEEVVNTYPYLNDATKAFDAISDHSRQVELRIFGDFAHIFTTEEPLKFGCSLSLRSHRDMITEDDYYLLTQSYVKYYLQNNPDAQAFLHCPFAPHDVSDKSELPIETFEIELSETLSLQREFIIIAKNFRSISDELIGFADDFVSNDETASWLNAFDGVMTASVRSLLGDLESHFGDTVSELLDGAKGLSQNKDGATLAAFIPLLDAFTQKMVDIKGDDTVRAFNRDYKPLLQSNCRLLLRLSDSTDKIAADRAESPYLANFLRMNPVAVAYLECPYGNPSSKSNFRKLANNNGGGNGGGGGKKKTINQLAIAAAMSRYADNREVTTPTCVLALGDNFYGNGVRSTTDTLWDNLWYNVYIAPYKNLRVKWYPIFGNHDYGYQDTGTTAQIERYTKYNDPYWTMPAGYYSKTFAIPGERNFIAYVIFIDTQTLAPDQNKANNANGGISSETQATRIADQVAFILKELQTAKEMEARWTIIAGHYPIVSQGEHGDITSLLTNVEPMLEQYQVDAYLCGHDHIAEVLYYKGTTHYVVGAGSMIDVLGSTYKTKADLLWYGVQYSSFGVMNIDETKLTVSFYDVNTTQRYNHTIVKHEPTALPTPIPTSQPTIEPTVPPPMPPSKQPSSQPTARPTPFSNNKNIRSGGLQRVYDVMVEECQSFLQQEIYGVKASNVAAPVVVLLLLAAYMRRRRRSKAKVYSKVKDEHEGVESIEDGRGNTDNSYEPDPTFTKNLPQNFMLSLPSEHGSNKSTKPSLRPTATSDKMQAEQTARVLTDVPFLKITSSPFDTLQFNDNNQSFNNILLRSKNNSASVSPQSPSNRHRRINTNMI